MGTLETVVGSGTDNAAMVPPLETLLRHAL